MDFDDGVLRIPSLDLITPYTVLPAVSIHSPTSQPFLFLESNRDLRAWVANCNDAALFLIVPLQRRHGSTATRQHGRQMDEQALRDAIPVRDITLEISLPGYVPSSQPQLHDSSRRRLTLDPAGQCRPAQRLFVLATQAHDLRSANPALSASAPLGFCHVSKTSTPTPPLFQSPILASRSQDSLLVIQNAAAHVASTPRRSELLCELM